MNKFQILSILKNNGDSILTIKGEEAICATTDFSTKYFKNKKFIKIPKDKNLISVWSWTDDAFKVIDVTNVKIIQPLSELLKNTPAEGTDYGK
jgi:hypothetical protein